MVNVKVLISSFEVTFWMVFWISISVIFWYVCYLLTSFFIPSTSVYGLMQQTFFMGQNYLVLTFFTFCYIIIDEGLQTANGMVKDHLNEARIRFEYAKRKALRENTTLDRTRNNNYEGKFARFKSSLVLL